MERPPGCRSRRAPASPICCPRACPSTARSRMRRTARLDFSSPGAKRLATTISPAPARLMAPPAPCAAPTSSPRWKAASAPACSAMRPHGGFGKRRLPRGSASPWPARPAGEAPAPWPCTASSATAWPVSKRPPAAARSPSRRMRRCAPKPARATPFASAAAMWPAPMR